jgi:fatty-acyl-CoA synthase
LNTPADPSDADLPLRLCFGNEAAADDIERFATRFGCVVNEAYGSSEGGASLARTPDTPKGALGIAGEGTMVVDQETGDELPRAVFDEQGRLLNAEDCIGELVSKSGGQSFEGYWRNDEAMEARLRNGWYWTGDLAYRDEAGFFYFAGRDNDWVRVDGENFAAAPVERILTRHPDVVVAAVYAVPDEHVGDQVMAALELAPGAVFDPVAFGVFLAAQEDLGTKWAPKYVRISTDLPKTATSKVVKKALRAERWQTTDPVWWRSSNELRYDALDDAMVTQLNEAVSNRVL